MCERCVECKCYDCKNTCICNEVEGCFMVDCAQYEAEEE